MLWMLTAVALASPIFAPTTDPVPDRAPTTTVMQWVRFFADVRHANFILPDRAFGRRELLVPGPPDPATADEDWASFLTALDAIGYQLVFVGNTGRFVPTAAAPVPER